jgi:DNA repair protein RadC
MKIQNWPRAERPRERLLAQGAEALSDAELLALFIGQGLPGQNAVELARSWLLEHRSLADLLALEFDRFCQLNGAGVARYVLLQAALELGRRVIRQPLERGSALANPEQVKQFLQMQIAHSAREHFGVLLLDTQHQVLQWQVLFSGTLNAAAVYPREVVKSALECGAAAIILAHNHPSGVAEPSMADRQITERIQQALALIDVRVLDHLVVSSGAAVSFAERGWL